MKTINQTKQSTLRAWMHVASLCLLAFFAVSCGGKNENEETASITEQVEAWNAFVGVANNDTLSKIEGGTDENGEEITLTEEDMTNKLKDQLALLDKVENKKEIAKLPEFTTMYDKVKGDTAVLESDLTGFVDETNPPIVSNIDTTNMSKENKQKVEDLERRKKELEEEVKDKNTLKEQKEKLEKENKQKEIDSKSITSLSSLVANIRSTKENGNPNIGRWIRKMINSLGHTESKKENATTKAKKGVLNKWSKANKSGGKDAPLEGWNELMNILKTEVVTNSDKKSNVTIARVVASDDSSAGIFGKGGGHNRNELRQLFSTKIFPALKAEYERTDISEKYKNELKEDIKFLQGIKGYDKKKPKNLVDTKLHVQFS